jgi:hypothetical protein
MPSSAVRTFTDPDEYAASIRATRAELTVIGRGHFTANLTRIDLHRLWMQRFFDNLPRVGHSAPATGRAIISFRTAPGPSFLWSGSKCIRPASYDTARVRTPFSIHPIRLLGRYVVVGGRHGFCWGRNGRVRSDAAT